MKYTISVDLYYILTLSDLWLEIETKTYKEIMHFHYIIYMATP